MLLPKDYVRLKLTGDKASDMSDSAGTLVARRRQARLVATRLLAATDLDRKQMPRLFEGSARDRRRCAPTSPRAGA